MKIVNLIDLESSYKILDEAGSWEIIEINFIIFTI